MKQVGKGFLGFLFLFASVLSEAADEKTKPVEANGNPAWYTTPDKWMTGEVTRSAPSVTPTLPTISGDWLVYTKRSESSGRCLGNDLYAQLLPGRNVPEAPKSEHRIAEVPCVQGIFSIQGALLVHSRQVVIIDKEKDKASGPAMVRDTLYAFSDLTKSNQKLVQWTKQVEVEPLIISRLAFLSERAKQTKVVNLPKPFLRQHRFSFSEDTLYVATIPDGSAELVYLDAFSLADFEPRSELPVIWNRRGKELEEIGDFQAIQPSVFAFAFAGSQERLGFISVVSTTDAKEAPITTSYTIGSQNYPEPDWTELSAKAFGVFHPADIVPTGTGFVAREVGSRISWQRPFLFSIQPGNGGGVAKKIESLSFIKGIRSLRAAPEGLLLATQSPDSVVFVGLPSKAVGDLNWSAIK